MTDRWRNWAGSVDFEPRAVMEPKSEEEVMQSVRRASQDGHRIRPAGAGHSSSDLVLTDGVVLDLHHLSDLESYDSKEGRATLGAGARLDDVNALLFDEGLMMENLGDVAYQALAGAVATGTHGSGRRLTNLSGMVTGGRLVTGTGELVEFSERDGELIRAARVSLGCLGIFTALTIRVIPGYRLRRREWCTSTEACLDHLDELMDSNRNFDFYWYPRRDEVKLRTWNHPDRSPGDLPFAVPVKEMTGWAKDVLAREQPLRFHEMEYGLPLEVGPDCFRAIRERILDRHRREVGWRVLCRPIAADDGFLSNCSGRETMAITVHQNQTLPYQDYFEDLEPIFRDYGGRPHWGKRHTMERTPESLEALYPDWDRFMAVRERLDPSGIFLSDYLRRLFGFEGDDHGPQTG